MNRLLNILKYDLAIINFFALILVLLVLFPISGALRIVIGLPLLLIIPGYVLVAALFPRKTSIGKIERITLSCGFSVIVVPLLGFIINYTPWGITVSSTLVIVAGFIVCLSVVAWRNRHRSTFSERFSIDFGSVFSWLGGGKGIDKALSALVVISVLAAIATLGYAIVEPAVGEKFTEFYVLGQDGKAYNYPTAIKAGESGEVTVGIINKERSQAKYEIVVEVDGIENSRVGPILLESDEQWEDKVSFTVSEVKKGQRVEFLMWKNGKLSYGDTGGKKPIHFWVDGV